MKKIFLVILIFILTVFSFGCKKGSNEFIDKLQSGQNVKLTQNFVKVKDDYKTKYNYDKLEITVKFTITIKGYEELSYFNSSTDLKINYNLLENNGSYKTNSYSTSIKIDACGYGYIDSSFTVSGRNIKDINLIYTFSGTVTKI